jgi:Isocitrate/isopropylmalate dehydrogenase
MMLQHMGLHDHANRIQKAIFDTLAEGKVSFYNYSYNYRTLLTA